MNAIFRHAMTIRPQPREQHQPVTLADLIPERARALGCTDFDSYCDLIDREATAHLTGGNLLRLNRLREYRRPRPFFDRAVNIQCLSVCLNQNRTMFAKVDAEDWIALQEQGWTGVWHFIDTFSGFYVYTAPPMRREAGVEKAHVARLILGLGSDRRAGFLDGDSLNLRRKNLFVTERPRSISRLRRASRDTSN